MGGTQANRAAISNTNHHSRIEPAVRQSQGTSPFLPTSNHRHGRMQTSPLAIMEAKEVYTKHDSRFEPSVRQKPEDPPPPPPFYVFFHSASSHKHSRIYTDLSPIPYPLQVTRRKNKRVVIFQLQSSIPL